MALKDQSLALAASPVTIGGMTVEQAKSTQFERGVALGANPLKSGLFGAAKMLGDATDTAALTEFGAKGVERAKQEAAALPPLAQPRFTDLDFTDFSDVADWAQGGLGTLVPSVASTVAGAAAGFAVGGPPGALAGAATVSAVPEAGNIFTDVEEETGEKKYAPALIGGAIVGMIDAFGAGKVARAAVPESVISDLIRQGVKKATLDKLGIQAGKSIPRKVLEAMGTEGATEALQGATGDTARMLGGVDIDPLDVKRRIDEAALGALGGGAAAGAGAIVDGLSNARTRYGNNDEDLMLEGGLPRLPQGGGGGTPQLGGPQAPSNGGLPVVGEGEALDAGGVIEGDLVTVKHSRGLQLAEELALSDEGEDVLGDSTQTVREGLSLARYYLENPDVPVPDEAIAVIEKAYKHPAIAARFDEGSLQNEQAKSSAEADSGYDDAVNEVDLDLIGNHTDVTGLSELEVEEQDSFILPAKGNKPLVSVEASIEAADAAGASAAGFKDSTARIVGDLNKQHGEGSHAAVKYGEAMLDEGYSEKDIADKAFELFKDLAAKKTENTKSSVADLYTPTDPIGFLNKFNVIKRKKTKASEQETSIPEVNYKAIRNDGTDASQKAVFKKVKRNSSGDNPRAAEIGVVLNGEPAALNIMNLVNKFREGRVQSAVEPTSVVERAAADFAQAITTVITDPENNVEIDLDSIRPDTVVYRTKDGQEFTYEQVKAANNPQMQVAIAQNQITKTKNAMALTEDLIENGGLSPNSLIENKKRLESQQKTLDSGRKSLKLLNAKLAADSTNEGANKFQLSILKNRADKARGKYRDIGQQLRNQNLTSQEKANLEEQRKSALANLQDAERERDVYANALDTGTGNAGPIADAEPGIQDNEAPVQVQDGPRKKERVLHNKDKHDDAAETTLNKSDEDTHVVAAAALELMDRMPSNKVLGSRWFNLVDQIEYVLDVNFGTYNPIVVRARLHKLAGKGTRNAAMPDYILKRMTNKELAGLLQKDQVRQTVAAKSDLDTTVDNQKKVTARLNELADQDIPVVEVLDQMVEARLIPESTFAQGFYNKVTEEIGIKDPAPVVPLSTESMHLYAQVIAKIGVEPFYDGSWTGGHVQTAGGDVIVINPFLVPEIQMHTVLHELGHDLSLNQREGMGKHNDHLKNIEEEYDSYVKGVLKDDQALISVITRRKGTPGAAITAASLKQKSTIPFSALTEKSKEYFINKEEWLADRIAAQVAGVEKVNKIFEDYIDSLNLVYNQHLSIKQSTAQTKELFDVWVSNRQVRTQMAENMISPKGEGLDGSIHHSAAVEAMEAASSESRAEIDRMITRVTGLTPAQLAKANGVSVNSLLGSIYVVADIDMQAAGTAAAQVAMEYVYKNMLSKQEKNTLGNVATSEFMTRQLRAKYKDNPSIMAQLEDPTTNIGTLVSLMYGAWAADSQFKLGAAPKSIFQKTHSALSKIVGSIHDDEAASSIAEAVRSGTRRLLDGERGYRGYADIVFGPDAEHRKGNIDKVIRKIRMADPLTAGQSKLAGTKNVALKRIVDMFSRRQGVTGLQQTYIEARDTKTAEFMSRGTRILEGLNAAQLEEFHTAVHSHGGHINASPAVKEAVEKTYLFMAGVRAYLKNSGVKVGSRGATVTVNGKEIPAYFPMKFSQAPLMQRSAEVIDALHRPEYDKKLKELAAERTASRIKAYEREADIEAVSAEKRAELTVSKNEIVDALVIGLINASGVADMKVVDDTVSGYDPSMNAFMTRELWWLTEDSDKDNPVSAESRALWADMLEKDSFVTMQSYIEQAVKRATFVSKFGPKGKKIEDMLAQALETGATKEELNYAQDFIHSVMGSHGRKTHIKINTAINWVSNKLGRGNIVPADPNDVINPKFAKFQQIMMVYENIRILDFAIFTSLVDPAGIAVRSGSVTNAWLAFRRGLSVWHKAHWKGEQDKLNSVAEMLGIIEKTMSNAAIQQNYGGTWMEGRAKQANDALFKYTGLESWTRITRLMATQSAMSFLKYHALSDTAESREYFEDLGLREGDITAADFDDDGILNLLSYAERQSLRSAKTRVDGSLVDKTKEQKLNDKAELEKDDRKRAAVYRYTNEAVLRPNAAQRPVWGSDPHFAAVFHLKQFMWSFVETTLAFSINSAKNGRYAPISIMGIMFPAGMGGIDALRDLLRYGTEGAPSMKNADFSDYAIRAVRRSGVLGLGDLGLAASDDITYGGIGIESFVGPTYGHMHDLLGKATDDAENMDKFLKQALPLQNTIKTAENLLF